MKDYSNTKIIALIDEYIHSQRDREILKRRYVDGVCYDQLGEEFGLSTRQIKNIVYKGGDTLFKYI